VKADLYSSVCWQEKCAMCISDLYLKFRIRCDAIAIFTFRDSYVVYMQLSVLPHYQYFSLIRENAEYEKT